MRRRGSGQGRGIVTMSRGGAQLLLQYKWVFSHYIYTRPLRPWGRKGAAAETRVISASAWSPMRFPHAMLLTGLREDYVRVCHYKVNSFVGQCPALLVVMYNAVCHKSIFRKRDCLQNCLRRQFLWCANGVFGTGEDLRVRHQVTLLKFEIINRALADYNPKLVSAASRQPHTAFMKEIT